MINVPTLSDPQIAIIRAVGTVARKPYVYGHLLSKSFDFSWETGPQFSEEGKARTE